MQVLRRRSVHGGSVVVLHALQHALGVQRPVVQGHADRSPDGRHHATFDQEVPQRGPIAEHVGHNNQQKDETEAEFSELQPGHPQVGLREAIQDPLPALEGR